MKANIVFLKKIERYFAPKVILLVCFILMVGIFSLGTNLHNNSNSNHHSLLGENVFSKNQFYFWEYDINNKKANLIQISGEDVEIIVQLNEITSVNELVQDRIKIEPNRTELDPFFRLPFNPISNKNENWMTFGSGLEGGNGEWIYVIRPEFGTGNFEARLRDLGLGKDQFLFNQDHDSFKVENAYDKITDVYPLVWLDESTILFQSEQERSYGEYAQIFEYNVTTDEITLVSAGLFAFSRPIVSDGTSHIIYSGVLGPQKDWVHGFPDALYHYNYETRKESIIYQNPGKWIIPLGWHAKKDKVDNQSGKLDFFNSGLQPLESVISLSLPWEIGITRCVTRDGSNPSPPPIGSVSPCSNLGPHSYPNAYDFDTSNAIDEKVLASEDGIVVEANFSPGPGGYAPNGYGNYIVIKHQNDYRTRYAHLSQVFVSIGQTVSKGCVIGLEGNTGISSGDHIHFEYEYPFGSSNAIPNFIECNCVPHRGFNYTSSNIETSCCLDFTSEPNNNFLDATDVFSSSVNGTNPFLVSQNTGYICTASDVDYFRIPVGMDPGMIIIFLQYSATPGINYLVSVYDNNFVLKKSNIVNTQNPIFLSIQIKTNLSSSNFYVKVKPLAPLGGGFDPDNPYTLTTIWLCDCAFALPQGFETNNSMIDILESNSNPLVASVSTPIVQPGQTFTLSVSGGNGPYFWSSPDDNNFSLNNQIIGSSIQVIAPSVPGQYNYIVGDSTFGDPFNPAIANSCSSHDQVTITVQNCGLSAITNANVAIQSGQSTNLFVGATGGSPPYSYNWTPNSSLNNNLIANPIASPTTTTTYYAMVSDVNGCQASDNIVVTVQTGANNPNLPDLSITSGSVGSSSNLDQGDLFSFNFSLKENNGHPVNPLFTSIVGFSVDQVWNSNSDYLLGAHFSWGFPANGIQQFSEAQGLTIPINIPNGWYYLLFSTDIAGSVAEGNENNNTLVLGPMQIGPNPPPSVPNLDVRNLVVSPNSNLSPGMIVNVAFDVAEENLVSTGGFKNKVFYKFSNGGTMLLHTFNENGLNAGEQEDYNEDIVLPMNLVSLSGDEIIVIADANGQIIETNENDNDSNEGILYSNLILAGPNFIPLFDKTFDALTGQTLSTNNIPLGIDLGITHGTENIGNLDYTGPRFYYTAWISRDPNLSDIDDFYIDGRSVGPIGTFYINDQKWNNGSEQLDGGLQLGPNYLIINTDRQRGAAPVVPELSEGDNEIIIPITLTNPNNLPIGDVKIGIDSLSSGTFVSLGDSAYIYGWVTNIGPDSVGEFNIDFFLSEDTKLGFETDDIDLGNFLPISGLEIGDTIYYKYAATFHSASITGQWYVIGFADEGRDILEVDRSNNTDIFPVQLIDVGCYLISESSLHAPYFGGFSHIGLWTQEKCTWIHDSVSEWIYNSPNFSFSNEDFRAFSVNVLDTNWSPNNRIGYIYYPDYPIPVVQEAAPCSILTQLHTEPNSIKVDTLFGTNKVLLSVEQDSLITWQNLIWYDDFCGGNEIGIGNYIIVQPQSSSTYFVATTSICGKSNCSSVSLDPIFSTSIKSLPKKKPQWVSIYPNPSDGDQISIKYLFDPPNKIKLEVFEITGRLVFEKILTFNQSVKTQKVDLGKLSSGVYFLYLSDKKNFHMQRLLINHYE